jgi:membrane protein YqaA with SNARE-associated domain
VGSSIGELPGYTAGAINSSTLQRIPGAKLVTRWMESRAALTIFLLAAVPNFLYDVGSLLAGASNMPPLQFFMATLVGKIVRFTVAATLASWVANIFGFN